MSMEYMCAFRCGECIAIRTRKKKKSCCSGCRYIGPDGCKHPEGVPESCSLWACDVVANALTQERRDNMIEIVKNANKQGRLMFREHYNTTRSGVKISVPVDFYGELIDIPAFAEDVRAEGFE